MNHPEARAVISVEDHRVARRNLYRSIYVACHLAATDPARRQVLQLVANDIARERDAHAAIDDARDAGFEVEFYPVAGAIGIRVSLQQQN